MYLNLTKPDKIVNKNGRRKLPKKLVEKYGKDVLQEGVQALERRRRQFDFERAALRGKERAT